jgi:hypothetical protein
MTRHLTAILAALSLVLAVAVMLAQELPPLPLDTADEESGGPVTYERTLAWYPSLSSGITGYVVRVNGEVAFTASTNIMVSLVAGTNLVECAAVNVFGLVSEYAHTNYIIEPICLTWCEVEGASSPLGPWAVTNLPPQRTNWTGDKEFYRLAPQRKDTTLERHL